MMSTQHYEGPMHRII